MTQRVLFDNTSVPQKPASHQLSDGPPAVGGPNKPQDVDTKSKIQDVKKHTDKFEDLINKSERVLFKATAIFPFAFFPDTVIIDENKVNIIHRLFFFPMKYKVCLFIILKMLLWIDRFFLPH